MGKPAYPQKMGEDRILQRGQQLIVCSKTDMDEWRVQENRVTAIYVNDEPWFLVGKQYTSSKEVRYVLDPWPEHQHRIAGRRIRYDEEYVRARDEAERKRKIEEGIGPILYHLRALIGFLPSRVKAGIDANFGVPARNATFLSIVVELFLFFVLGALLQIFVYGTLRVPQLVFSIPIIILLVLATFVDLIMRYNSYIREDASPLGVFEWIFGGILRQKKQKH